MYAQIAASVGLILIGLVTTTLIYWFGARRLTDKNDRHNAMRWTGVFALSLLTFFGVAPFLSTPATWVLLFPFFGIGLSLDSIQRIAARPAATLPVTLPAKNQER